MTRDHDPPDPAPEPPDLPADQNSRVTADMLALLHSDPAVAEERYEKLFADLTHFLEWQCTDPEEAAQESIYRAFKRVVNGADIRRGGLRGYTFGIAKLVAKEQARKEGRTEQLEPEAWADVATSGPRGVAGVEAKSLLRKIRQLLPRDQWEMLLRCYAEDDRSRYSQELGISETNLRVKIHRIRTKLKKLLNVPPRATRGKRGKPPGPIDGSGPTE